MKGFPEEAKAFDLGAEWLRDWAVERLTELPAGELPGGNHYALFAAVARATPAQLRDVFDAYLYARPNLFNQAARLKTRAGSVAEAFALAFREDRRERQVAGASGDPIILRALALAGLTTAKGAPLTGDEFSDKLTVLAERQGISFEEAIRNNAKGEQSIGY